MGSHVCCCLLQLSRPSASLFWTSHTTLSAKLQPMSTDILQQKGCFSFYSPKPNTCYLHQMGKEENSLLSLGYNKSQAVPSPVFPHLLNPILQTMKWVCINCDEVCRDKLEIVNITFWSIYCAPSPLHILIWWNVRCYHYTTKGMFSQRTHTVIWVWEGERQQCLEGVQGKEETWESWGSCGPLPGVHLCCLPSLLNPRPDLPRSTQSPS